MMIKKKHLISFIATGNVSCGVHGAGGMTYGRWRLEADARRLQAEHDWLEKRRDELIAKLANLRLERKRLRQIAQSSQGICFTAQLFLFLHILTFTV